MGLTCLISNFCRCQYIIETCVVATVVIVYVFVFRKEHRHFNSEATIVVGSGNTLVQQFAVWSVVVPPTPPISLATHNFITNFATLNGYTSITLGLTAYFYRVADRVLFVVVVEVDSKCRTFVFLYRYAFRCCSFDNQLISACKFVLRNSKVGSSLAIFVGNNTNGLH